jgi:uncharacterized protein (TIGR01777 family)
MKVLITGGSGFIGQALARKLTAAGHEVTIVDRNPPHKVPDGVRLILLDFLEDDVRPDVIADQDAVIHLMGVNLFRRWNKKYQKLIYNSRVETGKKLVEAMLAIDGRKRPKVFVTASAIGYYGNSGTKPVDESSEPGTDFLARLCQDWEAVAGKFKGTNVRTVIIRTGIVIGPGGLLDVLMPLFKLYIGGVVGSGKQLIAWVGMDDLLNIYQTAVENPAYNGAINAVAPKPVTLGHLTKKLADLLHRPRLFKVPAAATKPIFGQFSNVLLFSQNIAPAKLKKLKYKHIQPDFDEALDNAVNAS